ncbi:hypothetical protein OBV_34300 [Oscillibacter valericigenes Sjm18-20]|nr:hypothetical protein OBV_34300 [Oscillibacter valericigenes Sjm18-20]
MRSIGVYSSEKSEWATLVRECRELLARCGTEDVQILCPGRLKNLMDEMEAAVSVDVVCLDVTGDGGLSAAEQLRSRFAQMLLVLIADETMSPRTYMRPTILAASILFRPFQAEEAREVLQEVFRVLAGSHSEQRLTISVSGETRRIPYQEILYFEAREKHIFLRTRHSEVSFYDTMEHLSEILPEDFLRCHKSYIVNTAHVRALSLAKSSLWLDDESIFLPVSRTYKPMLKAWKERYA